MIERREEEHKYIDTDDPAAAVNQSGSVIPLSLVAQGTDVVNRVGNKIKAMSLSVRGRVIGNGASVNNTTQVGRIMIFIDKESNGTAPTAVDLFGSGFGAGTARTVYAPLNPKIQGRFKVLYDKNFNLSNQTLALGNSATSGSVQAATFHIYRKLNNLIRFKSTGATQSDTLTGHIYMYQAGNVSNDDIQVESVSRVTFADA